MCLVYDPFSIRADRTGWSRYISTALANQKRTHTSMSDAPTKGELDQMGEGVDNHGVEDRSGELGDVAGTEQLQSSRGLAPAHSGWLSISIHTESGSRHSTRFSLNFSRHPETDVP